MAACHTVAFADLPTYAKAGKGRAETQAAQGISLPYRHLGVRGCFEAVMVDSRCTKDYFTYATADGDCQCKSSGALKVTVANSYYYKILPGLPLQP